MLQHIRHWLGRTSDGQAATPPPPALPIPEPLPPQQAMRVAALRTLWTEGFSGPGGDRPALSLLGSLRLPPGASVLLVGGGFGGPALALAARGHPVTAYEADALALAASRQLLFAAARPRDPGAPRPAARAANPLAVDVHAFDPAAPAFPAVTTASGAILLDPLRGASLDLIGATLPALRPGGGIAMIALIADRPLDAADPDVGAWARTEGRAPDPPSEMAVARALLRLGCVITETEDVSAQTVAAGQARWADAVTAMQGRRPQDGRAEILAEAERWLRRMHLLQTGAVRLVRWLAIAPGRRVAASAAAPVDTRSPGP